MISTIDEHDYDCLQTYFSNTLGPLIGVAFSNTNGDTQCLYPEEAQAVARALPKRQKEFAAGRKAARRAMHAIGWPDMAIPSKVDRSPTWPPGLVGSISHSKHACVAIVGRKENFRSIGIDIEDYIPIESNLWPIICTPQELSFVGKNREADQGRMVTRIFSAKEAFYKWQHPITGRFLEFLDVAVDIDTSNSSFSAHCISGDSPNENCEKIIGLSYTSEKLIISTIL
jgi:enterobactin synthetase component D